MHALTTPAPVPAEDKAVFPVDDDDALGRLIALFLHNRLFSEPRKGAALLRELGWADSLVAEVGNMPINDMAKVLSGQNPCVGVVFDHRKAAGALSSYRAIKRDQNDLEFFIQRGATPTLIRQLFPTVSARVVAATRKRLGCDSKGGRPPQTDANTSHDIYRCWQALTEQEPSLRRRYMRLAKHFPDLSLATLCVSLEDV